jgi:recombination protein RecA
MVEVFGPESSGKTTLCITTAREFQKKGYEVLLVDVEQAFDMAYAKKLGVNVDELAICQPKNGEEAMNITNESLKSGAFGLVIVDSIAALITQAELDKEIGDNNIGKQAKLMSDALKKLIISASNAGCTVMFTNQIRMKIGVMFGSPETTSGGEAMKFYATQRIDMRKRKRIMDGDVVIGQDTGVKIIKNKVAAPYREVEIALIYGEGFDDMSSLINMAEKANVLVKSGAWYAFKGSNVAQGKEKMRDLLLSNPELKAEVEELLKQNPPK